MPIIAYRAKQSTDTAGTGTLVLNGASSNARSFTRRNFAWFWRVSSSRCARTAALLPRPARCSGTQVIREYEGVQHVVTVRADDFEYEGRPYQSLSAIARHITGTRWNAQGFHDGVEVAQQAEGRRRCCAG